MNIWFMIWVFIAVFVLGTSLWSFYILLKQKRAWEAFSKKNQFEFLPSAVLKSPYLRGSFHGVPFTIFSDFQLSGRERLNGTRTTFQVVIAGGLQSGEAVIGSSAFRNFINGLSLPIEYVSDANGLNKDVCARMRVAEGLTPYLTKERIVVINGLTSIKNSPALILITNEEIVLRIESADPFDNSDKLERFLTKLAEAAKVLSV